MVFGVGAADAWKVDPVSIGERGDLGNQDKGDSTWNKIDTRAKNRDKTQTHLLIDRKVSVLAGISRREAFQRFPGPLAFLARRS